MTRECSGCGLRHCDGRCFDECPADYEPREEQSLLTAYKAKRGEPLSELKRTGTHGAGFWQ